MRTPWISPLALLLALVVDPVSAQTSASPAPAPAVQQTAKLETILRIPAGRRQPALSIARRGNQVLAGTCAGGCDWRSAVVLSVPEALLGGLKESSRAVEIGKGRRAAVLRGKTPAGEWAAVVVAKRQRSAPEVVFSGSVGVRPSKGNTDVAYHQVRVFEQAEGSDIVVGRLDPALRLCGRETLLEPRLLVADELRLRRVKLQRLSQTERDAAVELSARPGVAQEPLTKLTPVGASSGQETLTDALDDDATTAWKESSSGTGAGEFAVFRSAPDVPVSVVNFTLPPPLPPQVQPPAGEVPAPAGLVSPKSGWLVTDHSVFRVQFEQSGAARENSYQVLLPKPERTGCIAFSLDEAAIDHKSSQVALNEISASAAVAPEQVAKWVAALSTSSGSDGEPEASLLALPSLAALEIQRQFSKLSPSGQARALSVVEKWSCKDSAEIFATSWSSSAARVAPLLRRCGTAAAEALAKQLVAQSSADPSMLELLVELSPKLAVSQIVPLFGVQKGPGRRALRRAMASVAEAKSADAEIVAQLNSQLSRRVSLELVRALGSELPRFREAALPQLKKLIKGQASFRTRYLLIDPVSLLASKDAALERFLKTRMLEDIQFPIRAHAAKVAPATQGLSAALINAVEDEQVRVRASAVEALGRHQVVSAEPVLLRRLQQDQWPLVRMAAVRALAGFSGKARLRLDQMLANVAETDPSPAVRRPAVVALGRRGAREQLQVVRESYDADEDLFVRSAAIEALGALCDQSAVTELTRRALQLGSLGAGEEGNVLGRSALSALGRLRPADLQQRLAPLFGKETPRPVQNLARAALNHPRPCTETP